MSIEWGSVANWVSGIGSLVASSVALFIAERGRRIQLDGFVGKRIIVGNGFPKKNVLSISVTNVGTRATRITNIGFQCGRGKRRRTAIVMVGIPYPNTPWLVSSPIPVSVEDGESANWQILLDDQDNWIENLVTDRFINSWLDIETLRFTIFTSQGQTKYLKPESPVKEQLHNLLTKQRTTNTGQ